MAVPPEMDRAHLDKPAEEVPDPSSVVEREVRAGICLRIAMLYHAFGEQADAVEYLDRVEKEAPDSDSADEARDLRRRWVK